ncbi:hypothetical protein LP420_15880 [Massilia sp. B-10]|nr:hypothetical protein LP420_15880 [Massilia sp. B-10]
MAEVGLPDRSQCLGGKDYAPLFAYGYGLSYGSKARVGKLDTAYADGGCGVTNMYPVFNQADRATWPLAVVSGTERVALGADVNGVTTLPGVKVETTQVNTQQDGKLVTWTGPARLEGAASSLACAARVCDPRRRPAIRHHRQRRAMQQSDRLGGRRHARTRAPSSSAWLSKGKQTVRIALSCFAARGENFAQVDAPFAVASDAAFAAAFANIQIVGGAALEKDAVQCGEVK